MVYIDISSTAPVAYIPTNGWDFTATALELRLKNTTDGRAEVLPIVSASLVGFMVCLALQLPEDFYTGEWQYELVEDGEPAVNIASGLLMAYDGEKAPAVEYNSANQTIQYGG